MQVPVPMQALSVNWGDLEGYDARIGPTSPQAIAQSWSALFAKWPHRIASTGMAAVGKLKEWWEWNAPWRGGLKGNSKKSRRLRFFPAAFAWCKSEIAGRVIGQFKIFPPFKTFSCSVCLIQIRNGGAGQRAIQKIPFNFFPCSVCLMQIQNLL